MRTSTPVRLSLILCFSLVASSASAYVFEIAQNGLASKWGAGPGAAAFFDPSSPPGTPGSATWSLMPGGVLISLGDQPEFHLLGFVSTSIVSLLDSTVFPDVSGVPYAIWAINDALNQWAAVSGFTNLGQVADGLPNGAPFCDGVYNGCVDQGDIRIGAYPFNIVNNSVITAHTFQPGTTALDPPYGSIGGDMHFNNDLNPAAPNQLTWVDDPTDVGADQFIDFYTVVLHELGHALGLGHSNDPASVMALYSVRGGAQRTLTSDDIAGIQAIYGPNQTPPPAPEPGALLLVGLGVGGRLLVGWRNRK